jgi:hypothetical protein
MLLGNGFQRRMFLFFRAGNQPTPTSYSALLPTVDYAVSYRRNVGTKLLPNIFLLWWESQKERDHQKDLDVGG